MGPRSRERSARGPCFAHGPRSGRPPQAKPEECASGRLRSTRPSFFTFHSSASPRRTTVGRRAVAAGPAGSVRDGRGSRGYSAYPRQRKRVNVTQLYISSRSVRLLMAPCPWFTRITDHTYRTLDSDSLSGPYTQTNYDSKRGPHAILSEKILKTRRRTGTLKYSEALSFDTRKGTAHTDHLHPTHHTRTL